MFSKAYLGTSTGTSSKSKSPVVYYDVRINTPYKDILLIQGSPLETEPFPLTGNLVFSLSDDLVVKKVSLKLTGTFKLEFVQLGRYKGTGNLASIVKEKDILFECRWDNLLLSPQGEIVIGADERFHERYNRHAPVSTSTPPPLQPTHLIRSCPNTSMGLNKLIKKGSFYSSNILEIPVSGACGTPYEHIAEELKFIGSTTSVHFQLQKGNYELPFKVMLPSEISETIEGLQSGSILYSFEAHIGRRKKGGVTSIIRDDSDNNGNTNFNNSNSGYSYKCHKYLRIFRTLSNDNLALQEEMKVGNIWPERLQYEVSIPSRAIPVGGITPITVKIFPFQKNYKLEKIGVSLVQLYSMKDSSGQVYDDNVTILKQSMTDFDGFVKIDERTGTLIDKAEIKSMIKMPDDLKKVTQDCDIIGELIQVRHKLTIQIIMKRLTKQGETKTVEIKANLPVLLYISPHIGIQGRLVLIDKNAGKIHFRSGKFVKLFKNTNNDNSAIADAVVNNTNPMFVDNLPPPNYQDYTKDKRLQNTNNTIHIETLAVSQECTYTQSNSSGGGIVGDEQYAQATAVNYTNEERENQNGIIARKNTAPLDSVPTYEQTMDGTTEGVINHNMMITTTSLTPSVASNVDETTTTTTRTTTATTTPTTHPNNVTEEGNLVDETRNPVSNSQLQGSNGELSPLYPGSIF